MSWIDCQHPFYHILRLLRNIISILLWEAILSYWYSFINLWSSFSIKWRVATKHYVHYDTTRPDITFLVISFSYNLRRYIIRCPSFFCHFLIIGSVKLSRRPPINDFYNRMPLIRLIQHILWLQIPMHDLIFMRVDNRRKQLLHYLGSHFLSEPSLVLEYSLIEFSPSAELGYNI